MTTPFNENFVNGTSGNVKNSSSINEQYSNCLPSFILNAICDQSIYASDIAVAIVNIPLAIFAFLVNLAIMVAIIRTPSLHIPVNVLLFGLATSDCLTGLVAQPVYASWRILLHHIGDPCRLVHLYQASKSLPFLCVGCTFLNLAITSVDRLYAVSKPLKYRSTVTVQVMVNILVGAWVLWFIYICLLETVVPKGIYEAMENITMTSLIIIPVGGHVLTFFVIRTSNRKIFNAAHNQQHAILFSREKKAFRDMSYYTIATALSLVPLFTILNLKHSVTIDNLLFPWANTVTMLVSSVNPVIQITRKAALREALKATFNWKTA